MSSCPERVERREGDPAWLTWCHQVHRFDSPSPRSAGLYRGAAPRKKQCCGSWKGRNKAGPQTAEKGEQPCLEDSHAIKLTRTKSQHFWNLTEKGRISPGSMAHSSPQIGCVHNRPQGLLTALLCHNWAVCAESSFPFHCTQIEDSCWCSIDANDLPLRAWTNHSKNKIKQTKTNKNMKTFSSNTSIGLIQYLENSLPTKQTLFCNTYDMVIKFTHKQGHKWNQQIPKS